MVKKRCVIGCSIMFIKRKVEFTLRIVEFILTYDLQELYLRNPLIKERKRE